MIRTKFWKRFFQKENLPTQKSHKFKILIQNDVIAILFFQRMCTSWTTASHLTIRFILSDRELINIEKCF